MHDTAKSCESVLRVEIYRANFMPVVVVAGKGVHEELTAAAQYACAGYAIKSREKVIRWLARFLATWSIDPDEIINETFVAAIRRFESFMRSQGCEIVEPRGIAKAHKMLMVRRVGLDATEPSLFISALEAFYRDLSMHGCRFHPNPMLLDDFERMTPNERQVIKRRHNSKRRRNLFRGLKYFMEVEEPRPPARNDPGLVRDQILEAGSDWPEPVRTMFLVISDSGCRIREVLELNAFDWWAGSEFGDVIRAPNKRSDDKRVKDLLLSAETTAALQRIFDGSEQHRNLPMDELRMLASKDAKGLLSSINLFVRPDGKTFSDWTLRNTYFKKTVLDAEITYPDENGLAQVPTPHILRHARIDDEVRKLDLMFPDQEQFRAELSEFADHMHCSVENIERYAAGALRERALRYRRRIMRERSRAQALAQERRKPTAAEALIERMTS